MKIIPVPSDGDCLYHAFIKGLGIPGLSPQNLRDFVANKITFDKDLYDDLIREWLDFGVISDSAHMTPETAAQHISNSKEWATSTVIHILADAFKVRTIVFQKINGTFYSEVFPSEWKRKSTENKTFERFYKDIYLLRDANHFELLVPLETSSSKQGKMMFNSGQKNAKTGTVLSQRGGGHADNNFFLNMVLGVAGVVLLIWTF